MNADDCVALFIFYCDTKLILYRKALNNASQMAMRHRLLATLFCTSDTASGDTILMLQFSKIPHRIHWIIQVFPATVPELNRDVQVMLVPHGNYLPALLHKSIVEFLW